MFFKKNIIISGIVLLSTLIIFAIPAKSQVWTKVPGTLEYVNFLKFSAHDKNKLFIGADGVPTDFSTNIISFPFFGYGLTVSSNGGTSFGDVKLGDYSIYDVVESPSNPSILLASARKQDIGRILISEDGGTTWNEDDKRCESSSQVARFQVSKLADKERYYALMVNSSNGLRHSDDKFSDCISSGISEISTRDLAVSKKNPQVMYVVGDNTSKARVIASTDGGITWEDRSFGLLNYRVLSVQTSPENEAVVVIGVDSITPVGRPVGMGIYYSDDYGKNWQFAGAAGASVYDIQFHPSNPKYWAAAGGNAGVFISGTGGDYWEKSDNGLPADYFARKIAIPDLVPTNEGIVVYASIYGEGIYKSRNITTSVNSPSDFRMGELVEMLYPVPTNDILGVRSSNISENLNYEIFNLTGIKVQSGQIDAGSIINISNLEQGTYFIKFSNNGKYQLEKFNKLSK